MTAEIYREDIRFDGTKVSRRARKLEPDQIMRGWGVILGESNIERVYLRALGKNEGFQVSAMDGHGLPVGTNVDTYTPGSMLYRIVKIWATKKTVFTVHPT